MAKIKIEIRAELFNPQGKLIKRYPWKKANSLLRGFLQLLATQISQSTYTIKDTAGTNRVPEINAINLSAAGAAGITNHGTVIGSSTQAVDIADNKLITQITANVAHSACTFVIENPDATAWRLAIIRVFTNNTGSILSIKEVALYLCAGLSPWYFCGDRTLYSVDVPIATGVTLTYRITITL